MMITNTRHRDRDRLAAWLQAEASGDESAAESALRDLMTALPVWAASPGFSQRVTLAATRPAARWLDALILTLAAGLCGLAAWLVPWLLSLEPGATLGRFTALPEVGAMLSDWAPRFDILLQVVHAFRVGLSTPTAWLASVAAMGLLAAGVGAVARLIHSARRSSGYALSP